MKKNMFKASIQNGDEGKKIYDNFEKMLILLQDAKSDKKAGLTGDEQNELYEFMLNNTGHPYKYSS